MNARQFFSRPKIFVATALVAVAGVANAGGVSWSVGVHAPLIAGPGHVNAVVSNGGGYYYPPQPVYVQPRRMVVVPQPYPYYGVQPVVYQAPPRYRSDRGWHGRWHRHGRAEAYANGYRHGYERGHDRAHDHDDRRGGVWSHRDR